MKIYNLDGTFRNHPEDTEFGWYLEDIAIDESLPGIEEHNLMIKEISKAQVERIVQENQHGSEASSLDESITSVEKSTEICTPPTAKISQRFPQIIESIDGQVALECPTQNGEFPGQLQEHAELQENLSRLCRLENFKVPSKEDLMNLINPVNIEAKALLAVVSSSKLLCLSEKETSEEVLRSINFRTTNSKHILHEQISDTEKPISIEPIFPKFNVLLNGEMVDLDQEFYSEIQNYHATKEDNMLSLMMELIITDLDSNAGDMSEVNHSVNELFNADACADTSDLGNSPQSSVSSGEEDGDGNKKSYGDNYLRPTVRYLEPAQRSNILLSIGLSEDIDKSIQSFIEEKSEMHLQLADIRESFQQDEAKVTNLINKAISLEKDLRETAYLENVIHLLKGNPEKVSHGKWPFGVFRSSSSTKEAYDEEDDNFIV